MLCSVSFASITCVACSKLHICFLILHVGSSRPSDLHGKHALQLREMKKAVVRTWATLLLGHCPARLPVSDMWRLVYLISHASLLAFAADAHEHCRYRSRRLRVSSAGEHLLNILTGCKLLLHSFASCSWFSSNLAVLAQQVDHHWSLDLQAGWYRQACHR